MRRPDPGNARSTGASAASSALAAAVSPITAASPKAAASAEGVKPPSGLTIGASEGAFAASTERFAGEALPAPAGQTIEPRGSLNTAPAPQTPAPQTPAIVARTAEAMVQSLQAQTDGTIELVLDPPELGRLSFTFSGPEQALTAQLTAERGDVQELMRRHADLLAAVLEEAGYGGVSLSFGDTAGGEGEAQAKTDGAGDAASPVVDESSPVRRNHDLAGGLDIRL
ncbi:MAG: flagellar hook-length control protein FliK [Pseudomonadota bacterium]